MSIPLTSPCSAQIPEDSVANRVLDAILGMGEEEQDQMAAENRASHAQQLPTGKTDRPKQALLHRDRALPTHGGLAANAWRQWSTLVLRAIYRDARLLLNLAVVYLGCCGFIAANFYAFEVDSLLDARVFVTILGMFIVFSRYVFVQLQMIAFQQEMPVYEREMVEGLYTPRAFLGTLLLRSGVTAWLVFLPGFALKY